MPALRVSSFLLLAALAVQAQGDDLAARVRAEVDAFAADEARTPPFEASIAALAAPAPAERAAAGAHLEALLRTLLGDEATGRAPTLRGLAGPRVPARQLREQIADALEAAPRAGEAAAALALLLAEEPERKTRLAAALTLATTPGPVADAALARVAAGDPVGPVLAACVEAHARRAGRAAVPALRALVHHHRAAVRTVARDGLAALGEPVEPFDPVRALGPELRALVAPVPSLAVTRVPPGARLVEVVVAPLPDVPRHDERAVRGFLLAPDLLLSTFLEEVRLEPAQARAAREVPLADEVERVVALRSGGTRGAFSRQGTLTAQYELWGPSGYEVLLGALLLERGELAAAARVLLPLFDLARDDRELVENATQTWGHAIERAMFDRFAGERDYDGAVALARHLLERFPGHSAVREAGRLAEQLPARRDEFRTFTNPTPAEWTTLAAPLPRAERIRFLCERLRIVNGFQYDQPGGVSLSRPQHGEPEGLVDGAWCLERGRTDVINPLVELEALGLGPADVPALAPWLEDDRVLPAVEFWRDFHPGRYLHSVAVVVGWLIDRLAHEPLCGPILELPVPERRRPIADLLRWAQERAGESETDLLLARLDAPDDWRALYDVVQRGLVAAVPRLLRRLEQPDLDDGTRCQLLRACLDLDGQQALAAASPHAESPHVPLRLLAGEVLFRWGDRPRGRRALASALAEGTCETLGPSLALTAVRALLETGAAEDLQVAALVFEGEWLLHADRDPNRAALLAAFGERGGLVARFYLRALGLEGHVRCGDWTSWEPAAHLFTREALEGLAGVLGGYARGKLALTWPEQGTPAEKAAAVEALRRWLQGELARLEGR